MWIDLSEQTKKVNRSLSHVNAHQRMASVEGDFNIQVNSIIHFVDISQSLSPASAVVT